LRLLAHRQRAVAALAVLVLAVACREPESKPASAAPQASAQLAQPSLDYVGTARCAGCHAAQATSWKGSDHARAMQEADASTVLGDFAGASLEHFGVQSRFDRRDGKLVVRTEGPDGALHDYDVAFTFGVHPLQQYLVRTSDGRLQALSLAWDSRPRAAGGQRWFDLVPGERVPPDDVLHWTRPSHNWNSQCAECHSTNLRKGYDPAGDRFATTWSDLDVGCEACHGPGSRHVAWAEESARGGAGAHGAAGSGLDGGLGRAEPARGVFDPGAAIARREPPRREHAEVEACAPCHARRSTLREGRLPNEPFLDTHRPALLEPGLYEDDGQMRDEVYNYGSFLQSPMYAAGVTCSDCHDPHSLALRAEGDALCGQCHAPAVFATPAHHHHDSASAGARCVSCHMPARTYMVVDVRHDHSFRVPRPDLSVSLGTPNACTDCHTGRSPRWAADAVARWFPNGRSGKPHYAEALHAGRVGSPDAERRLVALAQDTREPAIVRASALALLGAGGGRTVAGAAQRGAADPDPLVRLGALAAGESLDAPVRLAAFAPLLHDPRLAVRIEAGRLLADVPPSLWQPGDRNALADALAEYRAAQVASAERPESHVNLGLLHVRLGELDAARAEYETALRLAPWFVPAHVNLADLDRAQGRDQEGVESLRRALALAPQAAEVHYALGLALVRTAQRDEALASLGRAAELAPEDPRYAFAWALALNGAGQSGRALQVLESARGRHPADRDLLLALATLSRDAGRGDAARRYARALVEADPEDANARALLAELEGGAAPAPPTDPLNASPGGAP